MRVFCGIDWAEDHHDIAVVDSEGRVLAQRRIGDNCQGWTELLGLLAEHGDGAEELIPVAIETPKGLLVASLRATGRPVFAINPLSVARYRDRHTVSRRKSDAGDALTLAHILRTDEHAHRAMPADTAQVRAVTVLARAQQNAVWDRVIAHNRLRALLQDYFPALLRAFAAKRGGIMRPEARALLAAVPTPRRAARLDAAAVESILRAAGRIRLVTDEATRLAEAFHADALHHPEAVEDAMGRHALALLRALDTACGNVDDLTEAATHAFESHPDARIIKSFPGIAGINGARLLGEIGDDRTRFCDARGLKAYAGSAPVTRASGRTRSVATRRIKNQRLAAAGYMWAFSTLTTSVGARAHYDRRRRHGDPHVAAQRNLFNRLLGCLYHCLQHDQLYNETTAFNTSQPAAA